MSLDFGGYWVMSCNGRCVIADEPLDDCTNPYGPFQFEEDALSYLTENDACQE